jgi:hypothetical protein
MRAATRFRDNVVFPFSFWVLSSAWRRNRQGRFAKPVLGQSEEPGFPDFRSLGLRPGQDLPSPLGERGPAERWTKDLSRSRRRAEPSGGIIARYDDPHTGHTHAIWGNVQTVGRVVS